MIEGLDLAKTLTALLAIANPIGNTPLFLSMTTDSAPAERRRIALVAAVAVFVTLTVIAVGGQVILTTFGVTIDDLRIAGGLVVLLIGLVRDTAPMRVVLRTNGWKVRASSQPPRRSDTRHLRCDGRRASDYFAGKTGSTPRFFSSTTRNFAGCVLLALRPTV